MSNIFQIPIHVTSYYIFTSAALTCEKPVASQYVAKIIHKHSPEIQNGS